MNLSSLLAFTLLGLFAVLCIGDAAQKCNVCFNTKVNGVPQAGSSAGCIESFTKDGQVSEVDCSGHCFKSYSKIGTSESWARGCSAVCAETGSGDAWMKCCNGKDLCNGVQSVTAAMCATLFTALVAKFVL